MPHPSPEEFRTLLATTPVPDLVDRIVFRGEPFGGVPYVFRERPDDHALLRRSLAKVLRVGVDQLVVVGSAKVGFSLDPNAFPAPFSAASDIDVVVVDSTLFDHVWETILSWNYPRRWHLHGPDRTWQLRRMEDVYWGYFAPPRLAYDGLSLPDALRPLRDVRARWLEAFRGLGRIPAFSAHEVNGRLYRSWEHARQYHASGLRLILERVH